MADSCNIGVDTLGSETPTSEIIHGALDFAQIQTDCAITFVGRKDELQQAKDFGHSVVVCPDSVSHYESLVGVLRHNRSSSMKVGLELLSTGEIDGFVSTGDTAALMALSRQVLPMLPSFDRPAIIKRFDGRQQPYWMLDLGANVVRKKSWLLQFAQMGSAYATAVGSVARPRVSLLNIGSEARKGPQILRETASDLSKTANLNFVGFVEADRLFDGSSDVVVTDGFSGNVALKSIEGATRIAHHFIDQELHTAGLNESEVARSVAQEVREKLNAQAYNGASLIGLNGVVVKSHGRTDRIGIGAALQLAREEIQARVPEHLRRDR
ncbi:MAG: phosphate acyltransferase [Gammaproteobacteria bacterium]|nr:phosphate acyltransferase [Gammaproteobacteria bacterium]